MDSRKRPASPDEFDTLPPRKKQLRKHMCLICDTEKGINQFPSSRRVSFHDHGPNTCRSCFRQHLENEIDTKAWDQVSCPECAEVLQYQEVKKMTFRPHFEKYDTAALRAAIPGDKHFRYCMSSTCKSGQDHPGGTDEPIFRCQACGHKHCVACEIFWHEDETCKQFQERRKQREEENQQSNEQVEKISKPCPSCRTRIEKNKGCDHMTCSRCRHQFCWTCAADYRDIFAHGNHEHEKNCRWYRSRGEIALDEPSDEEDY